MLRAAQAQQVPNSTGIPFTQFLTVQITPPAPGFVLVSATATLVGLVGCPCSFTARLRQVGGTAAPIVRGDGDGDANMPLTLIYIFPVTPGVTTFALEMRADGGGVMPGNRFMTTVYIPFGYDGTTLAPTP